MPSHLRNMTDALLVSTSNVSWFLENSVLGHAHAGGFKKNAQSWVKVRDVQCFNENVPL